MNFLIFLFDFLSYIVALSKVKSAADLCFDLSDSIFLQMIFSLFNCCFYIYLCRKQSAIDQEWSRYFVFMFVDFALQTVGITICLILASVKASDAWNETCFSDAKSAFFILIISIAFAYVLCGIQVYSIIRIRHRMFSNPFTYAARKEDSTVVIMPSLDD